MAFLVGKPVWWKPVRIGWQQSDGFKWIVKQISHSSHWRVNKSIEKMVRRETPRVWVSKKYSYFIITFHKYQRDRQCLKLNVPALEIFKMSTWWWEMISLPRQSPVPAVQPGSAPRAHSASSLSPRLTSSDLLKKIISNGTLFALPVYQVEKKFDVKTLFNLKLKFDIFNAALQIY